jgi:hypothetical protein
MTDPALTEIEALTVGTIWYHPLAGRRRPFIVRRVEGARCWSDNLDDGATDMEWPTKDVARMERL